MDDFWKENKVDVVAAGAGGPAPCVLVSRLSALGSRY
jgi:hypothetical protein